MQPQLQPRGKAQWSSPNQKLPTLQTFTQILPCLHGKRFNNLIVGRVRQIKKIKTFFSTFSFSGHQVWSFSPFVLHQSNPPRAVHRLQLSIQSPQPTSWLPLLPNLVPSPQYPPPVSLHLHKPLPLFQPIRYLKRHPREDRLCPPALNLDTLSITATWYEYTHKHTHFVIWVWTSVVKIFMSQKQEVLIVLDDPSPSVHPSGEERSHTNVTSNTKPSDCLLDLEIQPESVSDQDSQSKPAVESLNLSDSQVLEQQAKGFCFLNYFAGHVSVYPAEFQLVWRSSLIWASLNSHFIITPSLI